MKRYQFKRVWALMLMTIFCVSAWGDGTVTIMRYLQSETDFLNSVSSGAIEIRHGFSYNEDGQGTTAIDNRVSSSNLCYWDRTKDALRFTGFASGGSTSDIIPNGIYLKSTAASGTTPASGPFSLVNTTTGFTLSMEAIINKSYGGSIARFFDATKYFEGETKIAGHREYCFLFKPRDNIEFAHWPHSGESSSELEDYYTTEFGSHTPDGTWASYIISVDGNGNVKLYINGVETTLNWITYNNNGKNPTKALLGAINTFDFIAVR